jgi:hypothetical protein
VASRRRAGQNLNHLAWDVEGMDFDVGVVCDSELDNLAPLQARQVGGVEDERRLGAQMRPTGLGGHLGNTALVVGRRDVERTLLS